MAHNHNGQVDSVEASTSNSLKETFNNGLFKENGLFVSVLGLCPALAVTNTFEGALGMGLLVLLVLVATNTTISLIRNLIPNVIRIPVFVVIIASEVTVFQMLVNAFLPDLASTLGVFISLITVNCVVFGRAEAFASKNDVKHSALDGAGVALGYAIAITVIGFVREFIGTGAIKLGFILPLGFQTTLDTGLGKYAFSLLTQSPGAFLVLGLALALIVVVQNVQKEKKGGSK
jgi:electron transport complex protein RnfE